MPIFSGEIAKDLAFYLTESEQIPSAVALGVYTMPDAGVSHAGGLLVQLLPGVTDNQAFFLQERLREMDAITTLMRDGLDSEHWIRDIFGSDSEILERMPVRFLCGCSASKVETAIKMLGVDEIAAMLEASQEKPELVSCEFCKKTYELEAARLQRLLDEAKAETGVN